jgi:hypothetical protein
MHFLTISTWSGAQDCVTLVCALTSVAASPKDKGFWKLLPKLKNGTLEISSRPKLKISFEWPKNQEEPVDFNKLVEHADELFESLKPVEGGGNLYLFIDELELRTGSRNQFRRDSQLIRDLIVSVYRINEISQKNGRWIKVICGVRSEVISSVSALGKEIEKNVQSFGRLLSWNLPVGLAERHPLILLMCAKIRETERAFNIKTSQTDEEIWARYFHISVKDILDLTWFRPRDMVRLLTLVEDQEPDSRMFTRDFVKSIRQQYSHQSWTEIANELSVRYPERMMNAIESLITNLPKYFTLDQVDDKIRRLKKHDTDVLNLISEFKLADVLKDLYRVGAIGNVAVDMVRFAFRGNYAMDPAGKMVLHQALIPHFTVQPMRSLVRR